jgi:GGDEF domain-containing protein
VNTTGTERGPAGGKLVHAVILGGDVEALAWVPRLFRDPQINLVGLLPTHPADLVRNLGDHGYGLSDPCPLTLFEDMADLTDLARLDLIIDTTLDPSQLRRLGEAGLEGIPRVNSGALELLLARPAAAATGGTGDRGAFMQRLTKEIGRAYRHGRTLGLILVDVSANGPGSPLADPDVERLAQAVEQSLRLEDQVAYLPHGQFAVLLPETGDAARHVAERLTSNLAALRIRPGGRGHATGPVSPRGAGAGTGGGNGGPGLRLSVGWSWFPHDAKTAQALMDQARGRKGPPTPFGG